MIFSVIVYPLILLQQVWGHSSNLEGESAKLLPQYSLDDILSLQQIPTENWITSGSTQLQEGRIVLTPNENTYGSLWLKEIPLKELVRDHDNLAFTLEWTFRSLNYVGPGQGGISFWLLPRSKDSPNTDLASLDKWPRKFNGLQLLIDNTGKYGESIRVILNDGSKDIDIPNVQENILSQCLLDYQDSSVPYTLRLSYSNDHVLKLQVDNKICFQTQRVKLWDHQSIKAGNLVQFGVIANNVNFVNHPNKESFEILRMRLFNDLTSETFIPNVNQLPQPVILQKNVNTDKVSVKDSMKSIYSHVNNYQLFKKLDHIEGKVIANDISDLNEKLDDIIRIQGSLSEYLRFLIKRADGSGSSTDFGEFLSVNSKLSQLLDEQEKIRELTLRHRQSLGGASTNDVVHKLLTLWLIPLGVIMLIMCYYTFRIKQDIMKTKLL